MGVKSLGKAEKRVRTLEFHLDENEHVREGYFYVKGFVPGITFKQADP